MTNAERTDLVPHWDSGFGQWDLIELWVLVIGHSKGALCSPTPTRPTATRSGRRSHPDRPRPANRPVAGGRGRRPGRRADRRLRDRVRRPPPPPGRGRRRRRRRRVGRDGRGRGAGGGDGVAVPAVAAGADGRVLPEHDLRPGGRVRRVVVGRHRRPGQAGPDAGRDRHAGAGPAAGRRRRQGRRQRRHGGRGAEQSEHRPAHVRPVAGLAQGRGVRAGAEQKGPTTPPPGPVSSRPGPRPSSTGPTPRGTGPCGRTSG